MLIICVGCVIPRRIHREFAARPRHTAARPRRTASLSEVEAQRRQTERPRREVARLQADDGQCARSACAVLCGPNVSQTASCERRLRPLHILRSIFNRQPNAGEGRRRRARRRRERRGRSGKQVGVSPVFRAQKPQLLSEGFEPGLVCEALLAHLTISARRRMRRWRGVGRRG